MSNTHHVVADQKERVDVFLARTFPQYSRSFWQKSCELGLVLRDGQPLKARTALKINDQITVTIVTQPDFSQKTLPILYEDDDVLVINKPEGLLTHAKGAFSDEFSVAEFVRPRTTDGVETNRPGIVHRLDRGTSGLIIAAKNPEAKRWLQKQFSQRKVKKTYIALVRGHLKQPSALLQLPLERNLKKPQTFRVSGNGKTAETAYKTAQVFKDSTLVHFYPLTGRTHQLRVHAAYLGHPIIGDALYGHASPGPGRLFLHGASLEITLPSRERRVFEAPLPQDLQQYLKGLS